MFLTWNCSSPCTPYHMSVHARPSRHRNQTEARGVMERCTKSPSIYLICLGRSKETLLAGQSTDRQHLQYNNLLKLNSFRVSQVRSTERDAMVPCQQEQLGRRWREDLLFQDDLFNHCHNLKRTFVSLFLPVVECLVEKSVIN